VWCGDGHRHKKGPERDDNANVPKYWNSRSISATTEGVVGAKKELQRTQLHNTCLQASSGRHFTSKTVSPGKSYARAVANHALKTPPADTHRQNTVDKTADKCADGDVVTLITTVQQIVTGLQTADTAEDRFSVIVRVVHGLVMLK